MNSFAPKLETAFRVNIRNLFVRALLIVILAILIVLPLHAQESLGKRIALVIGNSAYENVPELDNPRNDSADLAAALTSVGFEVMLHTDQSQGSMLDVLRSFRRSADGAEIALIYFAGHGIEIDRQNYLLPVDAVLETEFDVNFEAVKLETMIFAASGAELLSMVIVDACRNNPFAASMKKSNSSRSIGRGLSAVEPTKNTLIAYAAKEGTTAADGTGRNSPYASALIESLRQPDLEVGLMMRQVRDDVLASTNGQQEPSVYAALSAKQIFLNDTLGRSPLAPSIIITDGAVEDVPNASAAEIVFWKSISDDAEAAELESYLELYPDGFFAELARTRIKKTGGIAPQVEELSNPIATGIVVSESDIRRKLTRSEMVELQERLSAVGYVLGPADGIAGRRTEVAIREYEKAENLPISGRATQVVFSSLRKRVTDSELKNWRSEQAARASRTKPTPTRAKAAPKPKTTTRTKVVAPKAKTVTTKSSTQPSKKYTQFCGANKQCATSQCKIGDSGEFWRKAPGCKFCRSYAQRCR